MPKAYQPTTRQEDWATSIVNDIKERFRNGINELGIDPIKQETDTKWFYSVVIDKAIADYRNDPSGFLRGLKNYLAASKQT
jgi:hypothetical protein